jgi:hypothetical protein
MWRRATVRRRQPGTFAMTKLTNDDVEAAIAEASADQRALALLAAASDPVGTRQRIEELAAAEKSHDEAAERAEAALAAAESKAAEADRKAADVAKREQEFLAWQTAEKARLRQADADVRKGESDNAAQHRKLADKAAGIRAKVEAHAGVIDRMRQHIAEHDGAATRT